MTLTAKDLDQVQRQLDNDYRVELIDGKIVLMSWLTDKTQDTKL